MDGMFGLGCRVSRKNRHDSERPTHQDLEETKAKCDLNCGKGHKLAEAVELELEEKVSEILWTLPNDRLIPLTVIASRQEYSEFKRVLQDTLQRKLKWRTLVSMYHRVQDNAAEAKIPSKEFFLLNSPITNSDALTDHNYARSFAWKIFLKKHRDRMYYSAMNPQPRRKKTIFEGFVGKWSPKRNRKWYKPACRMVGELSHPASPILDTNCKTNGQPCESLQRQSTSSLVSEDHTLLVPLEKCLVDQVKVLLRQQGASQGMALSAIAGLPQIQKCTRQISKATKIKFVWKRFLAKYQNRFSCSLMSLSRKKTEIIVTLKKPVCSEQRVESVTSTFGQDSREILVENDEVTDALACTNEKQEHRYGSRNARSRTTLERELKNGICQFLIKLRRRKGVPLAFLLRSRDIEKVVREMQDGPFDKKLLVHSFLQRYRGEIQYKKRRVQRTKRKGPFLCLRRANPVKFDQKRLRALKVRCCQPPGATAKETKKLPDSGLLAKNLMRVPILDLQFHPLKKSRKPDEASLGTSETENKGWKEGRIESVSEDPTAKTKLEDSNGAGFGVPVEHSAQNGQRKTRRFHDHGSSHNAFLNSLLQKKESILSTERESSAPGNPLTAAAKSPTESKFDHGSSTKAKFQPADAKETILQNEITSSSNFAKNNYDGDVRIQESGYKEASVTHGDMESFAAITKKDAPPQLLFNSFSLAKTSRSLEAHQNVQNVVTNKDNLRRDYIMKTDKRFGHTKKDQGNHDQDLSVANENTSSPSEDVARCNQPLNHVEDVKAASQPCPDKIESVGDQEIGAKDYNKEQKGPTYQLSHAKTTMNSPAKQLVNVLVDKDAGKSHDKESRNNTPTRCLPKGAIGIRNYDRPSAGAIQIQGREFQHQGYASKGKQHAGPRSNEENVPWNKLAFSNTFQGNTHAGRGRQRGGGRSNFRHPRGRGNWGRGQRRTELIGVKDTSCGIGNQGKLRNQYVATAGNRATRVNEESAKLAAANDQQTVSYGSTLKNVRSQKQPLSSSDVPLMEKQSGSSGSQSLVEGPSSNPRRKAYKQPSFSGLGRISASAIKGVLSQDCSQAGLYRKVDRDSKSPKADSPGTSVEKEPVSAVSSLHGPDVIRPNHKQPAGMQCVGSIDNVGSDVAQPAPDQPVCTHRNESIDVQSGGPDVAALLHQGYEDLLVRKIIIFLQENPGFQEIRTLCNDEELSSILHVMRKSEAFTDWRSFLKKYSSIFYSMYTGRKGYIQIRK